MNYVALWGPSDCIAMKKCTRLTLHSSFRWIITIIAQKEGEPRDEVKRKSPPPTHPAQNFQQVNYDLIGSILQNHILFHNGGFVWTLKVRPLQTQLSGYETDHSRYCPCSQLGKKQHNCVVLNALLVAIRLDVSVTTTVSHIFLPPSPLVNSETWRHLLLFQPTLVLTAADSYIP